MDIRKVPDMPPASKKDEYIYEHDLIPPVGEAMMTHWFNHPEHAGDRFIAGVRIPKKRKQKLAICPKRGTSVGWGIHLVEGWNHGKLWLLALSTFVFGSLIFGVAWSVLKHDVQGAFAVAGYVLTLTALLIGAAQSLLV